MITVHHEKETDFSKNGYGSIDDYVFGAEVNWELNGQFSAYLEYPTFLDKANNLVNKNILRVPVPFMDDQLFRIYRTRKVLGFIQIEARHIFYDLLDNFIEDTNIVAKNGSQAIDQLLSATQYPHRFQGFSNINTVRNARMVRYNPVEALLDDSQANTFVSRWGGEIVRDNFTIRMYQQMGSDKGVHIQHKKDLTGYEATFDESTVTTRIMPIGFDGLKLPEMYVDSPLIDLDNPKIDTIKYDTVKAAIGEYANAEDAVPLEEAYALLRQYAKEEYSVNHVDEPRATVKVDFVNLHNTKEYEGFESLQAIHQGDTVRISVPDENFEVTSRLVAFKSDPMQKDHYTSTTLGNHVYAFTSSVNTTTQLKNEVEKLREDVIMAMQSASGKNRNFWGSADPNTLNLNADVGDNYFRANGEETMLYQYVEINGEKYWKQILDTAQLATIQAEVEEAQATANQAKLDASGAYTNAVAEAERLVSASDEVWQGKMTEFDEQVGLIEVNVQSAQTKADQALIDVGISTNLAQTAKDLADTAKDNAQTALNNASQAIIDAGGALSQAQELDGQVNTLSLTVDELNGKVDLRLTRSEVDTLVDGKGLVTATYVNNQITTTADGIISELTRVEGKIPQSFTEENLVLNSKVYVSNNDYMIKEYTLSKQLEVGKEYTIVLEGGIGLTGSDQQFGIYFDNAGSYQGSLVNIVGGIYKKTFTLLQTGQNSGDKSKFSLYNLPNNTTSAVIKWIKLVEGSVTDNTHTPSMSDMLMENDFTVFKKTNEDTIKAINTELSKAAKKTDLEGMVTESVLSTKNYVTAGTMSSTLSNYAQTNNVPTNTQFNQLKNRYDSMEQTIGTNGNKIAQMVMTDSLFSTKVLDSVEIGGRNYAVGTTDKMQYNQLVQEWSGNMQANTSKTVYTLADLGAKVGDTYTASIYIARSGGFGSGLRIDTQSTPSKYVSAKAMHDFATITWTVEEGDTEYRFFYANTSGFNAIYRIEACKFQIEKGNKRTDWNPSPLDKADQSQVSQLANSWALTLKSGNDIKTQINASTNAIRLQSKFIHLNGSSLIDNATIKSAHIDSLNANKITGNTADFNTIRTGVLQANVITSTNLSVDNAMIDKLFATDLLVERLTSKTAFINDIKAINISADRITTGTLNASNVSIINLDVNSLTGKVSSFIQSAWNGINGTVNIDSEGIGIKNNNLVSYSMRINNQGMHVYDSGQRVGFVSGMYAISGGVTRGLALATTDGYRVAMSYQVGTSTTYREAISVKSDGTIEVGHNYQYPSKINWMTTNVIRPDGRSTATGVVLTEVSHTGGGVITAIMNESKTAGIGFNSSGTLYKIRNGLVAVVQ